MIQWLRRHTSNEGGVSWIPGLGIKITHAVLRPHMTLQPKKKVLVISFMDCLSPPLEY